MRKISKLFSASQVSMLISSVGVLALLAFSSVVIYEALKSTVTVNDNGEERRVKTHVSTVEELLDEVGITVAEHDKLSHQLDDEIESGMTIDYETAKQVTVNMTGDRKTFYTTLDTIEDFLLDHNINITSHDKLSYDLHDEIKDGMEIAITKAFQVTVVNGGEKETFWTTGGTVKQFLNNHDISYEKESDDKLNVKLTDKINRKTKIKIVRVDTEEREVEETIPFEVETREDDSLMKGEEKVLTEGKEGLVVKTFEMIHEDGELTNEELVNTEVEEEGQNKVVAIGTKEKADEPQAATVASASSQEKSSSKDNSSKKDPSSKDNSSNDHSADDDKSEPSGKETLTMSASAYTANCNGCSGYTSTGIDLTANPNQKVVAVDPNTIPLGTKIWVEGYGEAIAGDTGGNIQGNRIDLHFPSQKDALAFGQKTVAVKILN